MRGKTPFADFVTKKVCMYVQSRELLLRHFYKFWNHCSTSIIWNPVIGQMQLVITGTFFFFFNFPNYCTSYKYIQRAESQHCFYYCFIIYWVTRVRKPWHSYSLSLLRDTSLLKDPSRDEQRKINMATFNSICGTNIKKKIICFFYRGLNVVWDPEQIHIGVYICTI